MDNIERRGYSFQLSESRVDVLSPTTCAETSENSQRSKPTWDAWNICVTIMDLINHILIIIVTVFLLCYSLHSLTVTNVHVALCTVGYILLMSEAIVILAGDDIPTKFLSRRAKYYIHIGLQILGLICNIAGVVIMYRAKKRHFLSIHGITGFTSLVIMCFLAVFGYPVFIAMKLRKYIRPVTIKFLHNFLGIVCFVVGMVSQCYGYEKSWLAYATNSMENIELICIILTGIITVLSLRGAIPSLFRQGAAMFR